MKLVVIEGVGKQDTIKKYLGSDYEVFATKGHVRDLPTKSIAIDVNNNFEPKYEIMTDKQDVIKALKTKAKKADVIYLATDPDREGEAISWHVAYILGIDKDAKVRVTFNEITKNAIHEGMEHPRIIDQKLVDAQQARRVLDRLVGYKISPILCKKIKSNLSAGRVQSVALKLIVDREREIQNFVPEEYWKLDAILEKPNTKPQFSSTFITIKGKKFKIKNKAQVDNILEHIKGQDFVVTNIKKSVSKSHAPAPFITSTMQKDAGNKLGMTLAKVTSCAQTLYEGVDIKGEGKVALVTYIRTDSVRVADSARKSAREFIKEKYGAEYVPAKPNIYKTKGEAQDAHEAIRPISLERTPEKVKPYLNNDLYRLYKLIYERFLASQMAEAEYNSVTCDISCLECGFRTTGKTPKFLGYTAVYSEYKEKDENEEKDAKLPPLEVGDKLSLVEFKPEQKFTKAPPRYTEASLVDAMEEKNIGRPATYAPTITILSTRKYVQKDGKFLVPTDLAMIVNDTLQKYFDKIISVDFTAQMEDNLDAIADGKVQWQQVVQEFYLNFLPQLRNANSDKSYIDKSQIAPVVVSDVKCDKCGAYMIEKTGKYGKFLACPNYPKCKNIVNINKDGKAEIKVATCPNCGKGVFERHSKKGATFYACEDKDCKFMSWDRPTDEKCPNCGSFLVVKETKSNVSHKCSNPECDYVKVVEQKETTDENS